MRGLRCHRAAKGGVEKPTTSISALKNAGILYDLAGLDSRYSMLFKDIDSSAK